MYLVGHRKTPSKRDMGSVDVLDNKHHAVMPRNAHPRAGFRIGAFGQPFGVALPDPAVATVDRMGDDHGLSHQPRAAIVHQRVGADDRIAAEIALARKHADDGQYGKDNY